MLQFLMYLRDTDYTCETHFQQTGFLSAAVYQSIIKALFSFCVNSAGLLLFTILEFEGISQAKPLLILIR